MTSGPAEAFTSSETPDCVVVEKKPVKKEPKEQKKGKKRPTKEERLEKALETAVKKVVKVRRESEKLFMDLEAKHMKSGCWSCLGLVIHCWRSTVVSAGKGMDALLDWL